MRDLQASHLVEAQRAQRLPVLHRHARRRGAQLLGDRASAPGANITSVNSSASAGPISGWAFISTDISPTKP